MPEILRQKIQLYIETDTLGVALWGIITRGRRRNELPRGHSTRQLKTETHSIYKQKSIQC